MNPAVPPDGRGTVRGTLLTPENLEPDGVLAYEGGRIAYAGPADRFDDAGWPAAVPVPEGAHILPGLVDLHCHGVPGIDFGTATADDARRAADLLHASGTTTLLASIRSAPPDSLLAAAARLGALAREGLIAGIHAEGPFLSPARCGSQDPEFLRLPDPEFADLLLDASDGELVTMTFAPELPGADELVDRLILRGVVPSVGHTDAADAVAAASLAAARDEMEEAGFDGYSPRPTVTHLFSGMPPLEPGSPGAAAACLRAARNGDAVVEVVADGMRLDPAMVRTVFTLAGGDNTALVSDALGQAGRAPTLLECVRTAVAGGVPLVDAVRSATVVPADALRLADEAGALRRGLRADALVLTPDLELHAVLRLGRWLQVPKITRGNT